MQSILVLGTAHRLQGAVNIAHPESNIDDPSYRKLLENILSWHSVDCVFEEASGCGPTDANTIATARTLQYFDVDLHPDERARRGMAQETGSDCIAIDESISADCFVKEYLGPQEQREDFWLREITTKHFQSGLMICGFIHTLSFSFKLQTGGFEVESVCYVPYHKLCRQRHAD